MNFAIHSQLNRRLRRARHALNDHLTLPASPQGEPHGAETERLLRLYLNAVNTLAWRMARRDALCEAAEGLSVLELQPACQVG